MEAPQRYQVATQAGALGTGTSSLKVFQDFFADLDLPVTLTQGDRASIPVAVYNYSGKAGKVSLKLQPDDWYSLDSDEPEKNVGETAIAPAASDFSGEPSGHEAENNPANKATVDGYTEDLVNIRQGK